MMGLQVLIHLSLDHYKSLLAQCTKDSSTLSILTSGVKVPRSEHDTRPDLVALLCGQEQALILWTSALSFCPEAVTPITTAIQSARLATR